MTEVDLLALNKNHSPKTTHYNILNIIIILRFGKMYNNYYWFNGSKFQLKIIKYTFLNMTNVQYSR